MKIRDALILGFLLTALFVSEVVIERFAGDDSNQKQQSASAREYYFDDAVLIGVSPDGTPAYRLRATKIRSPIDSGDVDLENVSFDLNEDPDNSWFLRADFGHIVALGEQVIFSGDVILRQKNKGNDPLSISTESLEYSPVDAVVTTEETVQIETFGKQLTSKGITAYLMEDRLELQSDVHGSFSP